MTIQVRKIVRIPTGDCGLSEPLDIRGYRPAAIRIPGDWTTANLTFRGGPSEPGPVTQVVPNGTVAGLAVDANAEDVQMTNAVTLETRKSFYTPAKVDPIDISALLSAAATIDTGDHGILWVFQKLTGSSEDGVIAVETDKATADHTSAIMAWAQYAVSSRDLPDAELYVPIGAVHVNEGGSGAFTWGTDSITAETEAYHDFAGLPEILIREDGTLALDAGNPTFTYGAVTFRTGTGTRVAATGKANVTISGSNVADGEVGAWLLYVLADDVEYALQLGNDYPTLADAQAAVANHRKNPMLALFGVMYVQNESGGNFVPGTTNLDAANVTTTFATYGPRFDDVDDSDGTEVTVTATADRMVTLTGDEKEALTGLATLQVRSGTSATPTDQVNSPTLELCLERA